MGINDLTVFTEVFPINVQTLPQLSAYRLNVGRGDIATIGGKLSYRLRIELEGHWAWTSSKVVTDNPQSEEIVNNVIKQLWREQPNIFKNLRDARLEVDWQPELQAQADFVARGLFSDIDREIQKLLAQNTQDMGNARIERIYDKRGWVVQGRPAVSISISSRLIYKQDLKAYAGEVSNDSDLLDLWVADKTSTLKGEVIEVVGNTGEHRERLLSLTQREEMQEFIQKASDDELVVRVLSGRNDYEYVVGALRIIVWTKDYHRFKINSKKAQKALKIEPSLRSRLVRDISSLAKKSGYVIDAYNSRAAPDLFTTAGFKTQLRFGGNQVRTHNEKTLFNDLRQFGLYKRSNQFPVGRSIRIGVVNGLGTVVLDNFLSKLEVELQRLDFTMEVVGVAQTKDLSRADLERIVNNFEGQDIHLLLAFFPDEFEEDEEEGGAYYHFKSLTVGRGIPSQVVYRSTIDKHYAMANIVMGILGKIGNIPFALAKPLEYADMVVGIDIARERKKRLSGSINATAIARIYFSSGEFLRYLIHDAPLEGETIPDSVLQSLFPLNEFKGKQVVIHRDGYFRGGEKKALKNWAAKIDAKFYLVEVIKSGSPRLYAISNKSGQQQPQVQQPPKGSALKINDMEALLVSSLPPFTDATPLPLQVRTEPPFTIEQALDSVLSLTLLHYGSLRPPKLPVTIHYSDKIAYLALRGIKPRNLEGNIPYWL